MATTAVGAAAFLLLLLLPFSFSISPPISDSHRSAASNLFTQVSPSLEDSYEALRVFEILSIQKKPIVTKDTCQKVLENLGSSSSPLKDAFYALKVNGILKCKVDAAIFKDIASRLKATVNDASNLLDIYYSVGILVLIKDQASNVDVLLTDANGVFHSIKALSQSDGKWRYSSNNPESSIHAAGLALEALAGVVSLASSEIDQSKVSIVNNGIVKLFDSIEKYDDGAFYFDEKTVRGSEHQGSLSATSSVVRGVTAFAAVTSGKINVPRDTILGLAKFFLGIGIPGDAKDFFHQVESLSFLESNRISIPLILSLPETVYSLTKKGQLKVKVNTVLGSAAPPLTVKLVRASSTGAKDSAIIESKELQYDQKSGFHFLDSFPNNVDVGTYVFVFEIVLQDSESDKVYATGGQIHVPIYITGIIKVGSAEIAVLDSDLGNVETHKTLDLAGNDVVSLSATHLQKLRLSFQLETPHGRVFKPHQAFLTLRHETKIEHVFLVGNTGKKFEIKFDFLGLVEKLFYLSGKYDIELTVGDAVMENSFSRLLGHVELDLPEAPEKAARPPAPPVDPYSRYGPKAEINHIFRAPEKRPPQKLSLVFLGLILLPFIGFLVGLLRLGVNLKNFPGSTVPATFATLFHLGLAAILLLYVLFWLKLDLFTTLKTLGLLGAFTMIVGHRILSHLASTSAKLKSA
ncbi:putative dolichyl-diphosphooligosaccharide--protein glycotransferase [Medicago truncatula]|uniref:Dolichyl-diphosphooligosaccharide--protein glycosyltransferase subunit 2 n=1 Tax=Medicago truncatula TaxID=3880 RepID=A0A072VM58_MEDTR|nr:dolichyl-diphosphooligosaccharide--protein glycosyltransferase subunit 2 [Medicago truncatula]KEH42508.1 oligosaccharyltransferase subunit ribophorin II [Medicago truncatula]RHN80019.1 putative dolichyl-diphosphooligosaccharide--protein glycotransferase [Medicago truncatula]